MRTAIGRSAVIAMCALAPIPMTVLAADTLAYGAAPAWVVPQQAPTTASGQAGAPVRILLSDVQLNLAPTVSETYINSVLLIQTPQGLTSAGTITLSWQPDTDQVTVHKLRIQRAGEEIDLLGSSQTFTILRREDRLEYAALSGTLTAVMQPEGLRVGDRIQLAYTLKRTDPLLSGVPENSIVADTGAAIARTHLRARWPASYQMQWKASTFLDGLKETRAGGVIEVSATRDGDEPIVQPARAPSRFAAIRYVQFSGHKSWAEISKLTFPMFDRASRLAPTSPLHAEVARIRTAAPDAKSRTEAALRLVQDQIRYVYLGMNQARLVPADVETTWSRRYGDCKAKTALLLGLLRELGVDAEPVAVSTVAGDALPARLPMISAFDHVLVRATVAGKVYWLDGTRSGDRRLDDLPVPTYRWVLPLTVTGAELLQIEAVPLSAPMLDTTIVVDASAGPTVPASFEVETVLRSDVAIFIQQLMSRVPDGQRDAALRAYWMEQDYWKDNWSDVTLQSVKMESEDASGTLRLSMKGQGKMNWQGDQHLIGSLSIGGTVDLKRVPGPNSDAPYLTSFPAYNRVSERIKLPHGGEGFSTVGDDVDRIIAGTHYRRRARIERGELVAEASERSMQLEFPASEAATAQAALRKLWDASLYAKLPDGETASSYIDRGNKLNVSRDYDGAIEALSKAIALDAKADTAWADRGISYMWKGDRDRANKDFDAAFALNPSNPVVFRGRGFLALRANKPAEAISNFTTSLKFDADSAFAFEYRARAYAQSGQVDKAISDGAEAIRIQPGNVGMYMFRASVFSARGQAEKAIAEAASLMAANPNNPDALAAAASIYAGYKMNTETMRAIDQAIQIAPHENLYMARASWRPGNDVAGKLADIDAALKLNGRSVRALTMKAATQAESGDYTSAFSTYELALQLSGDNVELLTRRGIAYLKNNQGALAKRDFAAAHAKATDATTLNAICWTMAESGVALTEALQICDEAIAKVPSFAAAIDSRAFTLLRLGRYDEAIAAYNSAIRLNATSAMSMYGRGIAKRRRGDIEGGNIDIRDALTVRPAVADAFATYGVSP